MGSPEDKKIKEEKHFEGTKFWGSKRVGKVRDCVGMDIWLEVLVGR